MTKSKNYPKYPKGLGELGTKVIIPWKIAIIIYKTLVIHRLFCAATVKNACSASS